VGGDSSGRTSDGMEAAAQILSLTKALRSATVTQEALIVHSVTCDEYWLFLSTLRLIETQFPF
jgi:hypothetical protein